MEKEELKQYCKTNFLDKNGNFDSSKVRKGINKVTPIEYLLDKYVDTTVGQVEKVYLLLHDMTEPPKCPICGGKPSFIFSKGYKTYCSASCINKGSAEKRKQTTVERYGVDHIMKLESYKEDFKNRYRENKKEIYEKIKETWHNKTSDDMEKIIQKRKDTCQQRYGVDSPFQSEEIKTKIRNTNLERYGVENPSMTEKVRYKRTKTLFQNYGVDVPLKSDEIKEKRKKTNIERYGVEYPTSLKEIKEKGKKTNIERYGYSYPLQNPEIAEKRLVSYNQKFYERFFSSDRLKEKVSPLFSFNDYGGHNTLHLWKCTICGTEFEDNIDNGSIPRCPNCYPHLNGTSTYEKEIITWLQSMGISNIISNIRSLIPPYEIDIFLPEYNIAIEFNGIYWHSELQGKDKNYHLNKTLLCQEQGIELIHIFEDEWVGKEKIIQSIILSKIGKQNKLYARKCDIKEITNGDAYLFYQNTHLQGGINSKVNVGMYYNNELVSVLSFSKPRYNNNYRWEITRYSNKLNVSVIGGFAKLLKYFNRKYDGSIITYSDRRYFNGTIYLNNGFSYKGESKPNYYYTSDTYKYNRMRFQKHKLPAILKTFDENLTEWENMQLNGWDRIWDCGNLIFIME